MTMMMMMMKFCAYMQSLLLPSVTCSWINIVMNQSDLKNKFIIFVKCRRIISVWCLYISVMHLSFPLILGVTHHGLGVGKWSRLLFGIKMLFQGQYMLTQGKIGRAGLLKSGPRGPLSCRVYL